MAEANVNEKNQEEVYVCTEDELKQKKRVVINMKDRSVVLFHLGERRVYAMDKHCYHAGGPLEMGQLRDIEEHPCVVCPWHKYILSLKTGEGMYQSIDPFNKAKPPEWKSKGLKQRTHSVQIQDGKVFLTLSDMTKKVESDYYYSQEYKDQMCLKVPQLNKKAK